MHTHDCKACSRDYSLRTRLLALGHDIIMCGLNYIVYDDDVYTHRRGAWRVIL